MYYTMREGVHRSWRDRANGVLKHIRHHNWLPIAVTTIVAAWLGLIVAGLHQTPPPVPASPVQANSTEGSINVGYKTNTPTDLTVASSNTSGPTATNTTATSASAHTASTATAAVTPSDTLNQVGGKGGDTASVTPSTDPSSDSGSTLSVDANVGGVVDASVGVGGSSLLQADVNGGSVGL